MNVNVSGNISDTEKKRICRLFMTPKGSIPFDREFGVDTSAIDGTPAMQEGTLLVEYARALIKYFPGCTINSLSFELQSNGITPKVVIGYA